MDAFGKLIILVSIQFCYSNGLKLDKGCPDVEPVNNFNLTAIYGKWHEIARYPNDFEKTNCGEFYYKPHGDKVHLVGPVNVPHYAFDYIETIFETTPEDGNKGILKNTISFGNPQKAILVRKYILAMDYDKYYIGYECKYNEETKANDEYAWIMTRSKTYEDDVKKMVENFINMSDVIDRSKLIWLDSLEKTC